MTYYCCEHEPQSLRPLVALFEAEVEFTLEVVSGPGRPSWLYEMSPQGSLPVLRYEDKTMVGADAVCAHLERINSRVAKLAPHRKKITKFNQHTIQVKNLEKAVAELLDVEEETEVAGMIGKIDQLLEFPDTALKNPFILGKEFTWVRARAGSSLDVMGWL